MKVKTNWRILLLLPMMLATVACCDKTPNEPTPPINKDNFVVLPLENLGASKSQIQELEQKRGAKIDESNKLPETLVATAEYEGKTSVITYYFEDDKYSYAVGKWNSPQGTEDFIKEITKTNNGFVEKSIAPVTSEKLFLRKVADKTPLVLSLSVEKSDAGEVGSYTFGKEDETFFSATRTTNLTESGLFFPLVAKGVSPTFMHRYESRLNHTYAKDLSAPDRGVYIFTVNDPNVKYLKYWFDVDTKSKLEESAIFFQENKLPQESTITTLLAKYGFIKTDLTLPETNTVIYYSKKMKSVAYLELTAKTPSSTFEPYLQFFFADLTAKLPKEEIDFPMPLLEFGTKPLSEVVETYYKKQPYFVNFIEDATLLGGKVETKSKDFPTITVSSMDGTMTSNYFFCIVYTTDQRVIASPALIKLLEDKGFTKKEGPAILTYVNNETKVQAQIDLYGVIQDKIYCIAFEPIM